MEGEGCPVGVGEGEGEGTDLATVTALRAGRAALAANIVIFLDMLEGRGKWCGVAWPAADVLAMPWNGSNFVNFRSGGSDSINCRYSSRQAVVFSAEPGRLFKKRRTKHLRFVSDTLLITRHEPALVPKSRLDCSPDCFVPDFDVA